MSIFPHPKKNKPKSERKTMYHVEIPLKLPSLNEYTNANRTKSYKGAKMKKDVQAAITPFLETLPKIEKPIKIHFTWVEGNKRRDPDNCAFGKKFILDAMVNLGKLKDDNRKNVTAFTDDFEYGKSWMVKLDIEETE